MGKDKRNTGLDALKAIKNRVPSAISPRPKPAIKAAPVEPDDTTLFRSEVGRIQPLRSAGRAEVTAAAEPPLVAA